MITLTNLRRQGLLKGGTYEDIALRSPELVSFGARVFAREWAKPSWENKLCGSRASQCKKEQEGTRKKTHYEHFWENPLNSAMMARCKAWSLTIVPNAIHMTCKDDVSAHLVKCQHINMFLLV